MRLSNGIHFIRQFLSITNAKQEFFTKGSVAICASALIWGAVPGLGAAEILDATELGNTAPGFIVKGASTDDESGRSVSGAGDVNGDGIDDILIGSPRGRTGSANGAVYVVFGKLNQETVELSDIGTMSNSEGFRIQGVSSERGTGYTVAGAGDVNGDGLADIVLGVPGDLTFNFSSDGPYCYVVFGKSNSDTIELADIGTMGNMDGFRVDSISPIAALGWSVSSAGDVNGDGLSDVLLGAIREDPNSVSLAGESYVVFGKTDGETVNLAQFGTMGNTEGYRISGANSPDRLGSSVASAGDFNGDGIGDIVVGAWTAAAGGRTNAGKCYVLYGKSDGGTINLADFTTTMGLQIDGLASDDYLGWSSSGGGDINGDGLGDVIIGAFGADPLGRDSAGENYVIFGKMDSDPVDLENLGADEGFKIYGAAAGDEAGHVVADAYDINGDGLDDVIVSSFRASNSPTFGATWVVFGKTDGDPVDLAELGDSGNSQGFLIYNSEFPFSGKFGFSASGARDVNADGLGDVIVGAYDSSYPGGSQAGITYVAFGPGPNIVVPSIATETLRLNSGAVPTPSPATTPSSTRIWVGFDAGDFSAVTTTLQRNRDGLPFEYTGPNTLSAVWSVSTARAGWSEMSISIRYSEDEISGLDETDLTLYQAASIVGPYTEAPANFDYETNTVNADVSSTGFFILATGTSRVADWMSF